MRLSLGQTVAAALLGITTVASGSSAHVGKYHHGHAQRHAEIHAARSMTQERRSPLDSFSIELINNVDSDDMRAYIVTNSAGTNQAVLITADGSIYKPIANQKGVVTPIPESANCGIRLGALGSTTTIVMPVHLLQGRVYISDGELDIGVLPGDYGSFLQMPSFAAASDPNYNTSFGFVEANMPDTCMWANPTYVDFTGLPLGLELQFDDATVNVTGLPSGGISKLCQKLKEEEDKDKYPWSELCINDENGHPFRVLSPQHKADSFEDYYDEYIDQVWQSLAKTGIKFDLQDGSPLVPCSFSGDQMLCDRPGTPFPKPKTADIWGCNSGPFAQTTDSCYNMIGARLCAAFHRATLLLPGGDVQPNVTSDHYYPEGVPHNKYASLLHQVQTDHQGYAFPYDDVKPDASSEVSGLFSGDNPRVLRIVVGGYSSGDEQESTPSEGSSDTSGSSASGASSSPASSQSASESPSSPSLQQSSSPLSRSSPAIPSSFSNSPTQHPSPSSSPTTPTALAPLPNASPPSSANPSPSASAQIPQKNPSDPSPPFVEVVVIETTFVTKIVTQTDWVSSLPATTTAKSS